MILEATVDLKNKRPLYMYYESSLFTSIRGIYTYAFKFSKANPEDTIIVFPESKEFIENSCYFSTRKDDGSIIISVDDGDRDKKFRILIIK